jgi:hypothetical protein
MMILKDATLCGEKGERQSLRGAIYGDTRGRFKDGEYVFTSHVVDFLPGNIYRTRNSTYKVEFADIKERRASAL